ncbi:MAG: response regulator [Lachnospiraceae bacterium]|nr:response regulator [Lachnospiraceae bacterium]
MTERKKRFNSKFQQFFVVVMAVILVGLMLYNVLLMYDIAAKQAEEIGQMRVQNIATGFQKSLTESEYTLERVCNKLEEMIQNGATESEIRNYLSERKKYEQRLSGGVCLNVYCVIDGVVMISDMETPEDFVLQDRIWYRGLLATGGDETYISPTYDDAFTDNMCFTVAKLLEDGSAVALDYSVAKIQSFVDEMSGEEDGDAIIVDANEIIVGYTDQDMIGQKVSTVLPQYRNVFLHAISSDEDNMSIKTSVAGEDSTIFCNKTENGWYMMCSISNSALYRENYRQLLHNFCYVLVLVIAIVVVYFMGLKERRRAERILRSALKKHTENIDTKEKRQVNLTVRNQRKYQIGITGVFVLTMIVAIYGSASMSINESRIKMEEELREYNYEVGDWVLEQKSILDMFNNVVAAKPEMLNDYNKMVKFLDDITKHYPKISATYIANPDFPHGHPMVMNNGWVPEEDYVEEERIWYTGALTAEDFNITEPYYDARTGEYCVTFSKVVKSDKGEFYGVFAIDFYLDVLMDILGESYSDRGYAFLVDRNGLIIDHPNPDYEFSDDHSVNVHELVYDRLYSGTGMIIIKDYDEEYKVCASMDEKVSGFRIVVVKDWWSIYGNVLQYAVLFLILFGVCIIAVNVIINKMIKWQAKANDSLKEAAESAIRAEQAKSRFLSNMSHEIRTPINAVLGMNEMILRECNDENLLSYAANIQSSGNTLLFLINDILDMSKIESGKMEIVPVEYDMTDIVIDLWNVIYLRAQEKSLTVDFLLDETLPSKLFGDEVRIKQIVTNLLTNAVKYTPKGGIQLCVDYQKNGEDMIDLIISVKDTGMGIREEDMGKLFDSFQRLDEEKNRNIEGTGLGMNITMSLLKLMDGDMKVESEYQKGSAFTVTIPQKVLSSETTGDFDSIMDRKRSALVQKGESFEAPDANVLVVDDNDMNLAVFKALLKRTKMNIVTADSGRKCLELVKKQPFHIIFMDHMMPEMDGIETLHEIEKLSDIPNEETPVIALTANALSGARESYLKEGFADFLTKPIDAAMLEQMVVSYLPREIVQIREHTKDSGVYEEENDIKNLSVLKNGEDRDENDGQGASDSGREALVYLGEKGFNTDAGLQYCRGDNELYEEMLVKFAKDAERKIEDIQASFREEDYENYQIMVHALKSTSKMIGVDFLSEMAKDSEQAAKDQNVAYIKEHHDILLDTYREAVQNISDVLSFEEPETSEEIAAGTEVSKEEFLAYLSDLKESLDTFEADKAEALLAEMKHSVYEGNSVSEILKDIRQDVEDFELGAAAEKVEALIGSLT